MIVSWYWKISSVIWKWGRINAKPHWKEEKRSGLQRCLSHLVDVVVFLPITMVDGMIADILRQFSLVVVVSTLMSLFVCFTLTPLLVSRFGKLTHPSKKKIRWTYYPLGRS